MSIFHLLFIISNLKYNVDERDNNVSNGKKKEKKRMYHSTCSKIKPYSILQNILISIKLNTLHDIICLDTNGC